MITQNIYSILLTGLLLLAACDEQTDNKKQIDNSTSTQTDNNELIRIAHPRAMKILTQEFYWSPIEESGPFGNDDGSDAFYGFREWRQNNKAVSPAIYLKELLEGWGYPSLDLNEMNEENLKKYISSSRVGARALTGQDNAIIAVGFGQFVLEGKIDDDIKRLTKIALQRELLPDMIERWGNEYKTTRTEQLTEMLAIVDKMNE